MTSTQSSVPLRIAARQLMRRCAKAALATSLTTAEAAGWPYASLVTVATDHDGTPILLLSQLSDHTRNIAADSRVSLLFDGTDGFENPQQGPRVTVLGRALRDGDDEPRRRFLLRHPAAALYAGFGDFAFYRVEPERAHLVGGFARAVWLENRLLVEPVVAARLRAAEAEIVAAVNRERADAVALMAERLLGLPAGEWRLTSADADGCDLRCGDRAARLAFDLPVDTPEAVRGALAVLARRAEAGGDAARSVE